MQQIMIFNIVQAIKHSPLTQQVNQHVVSDDKVQSHPVKF